MCVYQYNSTEIQAYNTNITQGKRTTAGNLICGIQFYYIGVFTYVVINFGGVY